MATTQLTLRKGSSNQHSSFIGGNGELTAVTNINGRAEDLRLHDGLTPGGIPVTGLGSGAASFNSFAELLTEDLSEASIVQTKHYYADWDDGPNYPRGNAVYVKTEAAGTAGETDGGGYFIDTSGSRWELLTDGRVFVSQFGAIPDQGTTDNRQALQASIDYATSKRLMWVVDPTRDVGDGVTQPDWYGVGSFNPLYPEGYCLRFPSSRHMQIQGNRTRSTNIRYYGTTPGKAVVWLANPDDFADWGYIVERLGVSATALEDDQASCVLDHAVYARNNRPLARCKFRDNTFSGGLESVFLGSMYLSEFTGNEWRYGVKDGWSLGADTRYALTAGEVTTSINYQNNWARLCGQYGHRVFNQLWYSNFESNACDSLGSGGTGSTTRMQTGYYFGNLRGVGFYNNGAEGVDKIFRCADARAVTIDNFWTSSCGPTDGSITPYAYEFAASGTDVKISGITAEIAARFDKLIGVTNPSGSLLIQILDASATSDKVFIAAGTGTFTNFVRWPNDTDVGAMRAQKRTGNVIHPDKQVNITPNAGYSNTQVAKYTLSTSGSDATDPTVTLLKTTGGDLASTIHVKAVMSRGNAAVAQVWEGVARISSGGGRNIQYWEKVSGNGTTTPTLVWDTVNLNFNAGSSFSQCIVDISFHSRNGIGVEFEPV